MGTVQTDMYRAFIRKCRLAELHVCTECADCAGMQWRQDECKCDVCHLHRHGANLMNGMCVWSCCFICRYGVDVMSTKECLQYFGDFGPMFVEWINDSSCEFPRLHFCTLSEFTGGGLRAVSNISAIQDD